MSRVTVPTSLTDLTDPRLAQYSLMSDGRAMTRAGLFVAEGRLVVTRVLQDPRYHVQSLLLSPSAFNALAPVLDAVEPRPEVFEIPPHAFAQVTGHDIHRGCLGLVRRPPRLDWRSVASTATTLLVLEAIADADNVGSLFRSARALGVDGVLLSPACCDPLYRKAIRTSMGAVLGLPWAVADAWPTCLSELRACGLVLAALTPSSDAVDLAAFAEATSAARVAWMLGTEGAGLTHDALAASDVRVRIPMSSGVDSLNVAVAAAVALSRRFEMTQPR